MFSIKNTTQTKEPKLPYQKIKEEVLGKDFELSLVFCSDHLSKKLNKQSRGKNYPTNILTFPLDDDAGEIFINLKLAKKEAPNFEKSFSDFVGLLVIHGLMHLKGYEHSSKMEEAEKKIRKKFKI